MTYLNIQISHLARRLTNIISRHKLRLPSMFKGGSVKVLTHAIETFKYIISYVWVSKEV